MQLKKPTVEIKKSVERKVALIRAKPAIWGEGGLVCQEQLPRFCSDETVSKGEKGDWGESQ